MKKRKQKGMRKKRKKRTNKKLTHEKQRGRKQAVKFGVSVYSKHDVILFSIVFFLIERNYYIHMNKVNQK